MDKVEIRGKQQATRGRGRGRKDTHMDIGTEPEEATQKLSELRSSDPTRNFISLSTIYSDVLIISWRRFRRTDALIISVV